MRVLKDFKGYSGSKIQLIQDEDKLFVRKQGNIDRNIMQLSVLRELQIKVPTIYRTTSEYFDMEYVKGYDMKTYLLNHKLEDLLNFLAEVLDKLAWDSKSENFSRVFNHKLKLFPWGSFNLPFTQEELLARLPKLIPVSSYHGDFTLDNVLFDHSGKFVLIDPLKTEYESYIFDIAKMRQDVECYWFTRDDYEPFVSKLATIDNFFDQYRLGRHPAFLILMLMRVLPYTYEVADKEYLLSEIDRLWKL